MKVCFVSHSSSKGGAERSLIETIDALANRGVECFVLLPNKALLLSELEKRNISYAILPYKWWMSGKGSPLWMRGARIALNLLMIIPVAIKIKQSKCDIVYTNTISISIGALGAKFTRRSHVWHIREFGYEDHNLVFDIGEKLSLWFMKRLPSVYIANSYAVAEKYRQLLPDRRMEVIYQEVNTIDTGEPLPDFIKKQINDEADIKCAIIGGLQIGKGHEDAIRATGKLVSKGIKAKLFIIGDGELKYKKYLYNLVAQYNIEKYVIFLGYIDNSFLVMKSIDIVLVCSRCEAFGRVTVEAMRAGKPVVGTRSGGTIELIQEGFNGFLYTPEDHEELAEKIMYLCKHPEIAKQMGENGQKWAALQFTEERYGEKLLAVLKQLASQ